MKKTLSLLLAVLVLASLSVVAFAAPSPEAEGAPKVTKAVDANGNDVAEALVVTPVTDKADLAEEAQEEFDAAVEALAVLTAAMGKVDASDVFFVEAKEDVAFPLTLEIKVATPDDFVALLHFVDGNWVLVPATVADGAVSGEVDSLGAFAVLSLTK